MALTDRALLELILGTDEFDKDVEASRQKFSKAVEAMEKAAKQIDFDPTSEEARELASEVEASGIAFKRLTAASKRFGDEAKGALDQLKADKLEKELNEARATFTRLVNEAKRARGFIDFDPASESAKRMAAAIDRAAARYSSLSRQARQRSKEVEQAIDGVNDAFARTSGSTQRLVSGLGKLKAALGVLGVAIVSGALSRLAVDAARAATEIESLENALRASVGSEEFGSEMAFVRAEVDRLGLAIVPAIRGFTNMSAAAKGTALEGEDTRRIFSAVSTAMAVLGRSADETNGALVAIQQIISKGKVSAEELRQQLGERLPGAFQAMAEGLGVTTKELDKMLELGEVGLEALIPFAEQLEKRFREGIPDAVASSRAALNRFQNSVFEARAAFGEGFLDSVRESLNSVGAELATNEELFQSLGRAVGEVAGALLQLVPVATRVAESLAPVAETVAGIAESFRDLIATSPIKQVTEEFTAFDEAIGDLAGKTELTRDELILFQSEFLKLFDNIGSKVKDPTVFAAFGESLDAVIDRLEALAANSGTTLQEPVQRVIEQLREMATAAAGAKKEVEELAETGTQLDRLSDSAKKLLESVDVLAQLEEKAQDVNDVFLALVASGETSGARIDALAEKAGELAKAYREAGEEVPESLDSIIRASSKFEELNEQADRLVSRLNQLTSSGSGTKEEFKAISSEAEKLVKAFEDIGQDVPDDLEAIAEQAEAMAEGFEGAADATDKFYSALKRVLDLEKRRAQEQRRDDGTQGLIEEKEELERRERELLDTQGQSVEQINELFEVQDRLADITAELGDAADDTGRSFADLVREQQEAEIAAYEQAKAEQELAEAVQALQDGTAGLNEEQREQRKQFEENEQAIDRYSEQLERLRGLQVEFNRLMKEQSVAVREMKDEVEELREVWVNAFTEMLELCEKLKECLSKL